jgi:hypothetical protein
MPTYRTDEQLEEIGRGFLRRLGLEHRLRPEPMTVIAKLKHVVPGFGYRRVPDRDMPDAEAEWDSDTHEIAMRESIFIGMQRGDPHSCFVVLHELSHHCLGHQGTRNRIADPRLRRMSAPLVRHEESEASPLGGNPHGAGAPRSRERQCARTCVHVRSELDDRNFAEGRDRSHPTSAAR